MAKKPTPLSSVSKSAPPVKAPAARSAAPVSTSVRNTPLPKAQPKREITYEMIAKRAFEIHCSGTGGSQDDNWFRAERELRGS